MTSSSLGIDLLELCHKTRGWTYVVIRVNGQFVVELDGQQTTNADLHQAAIEAMKLADAASGDEME